jgi:type I restriction enzyme M protein
MKKNSKSTGKNNLKSNAKNSPRKKMNTRAKKLRDYENIPSYVDINEYLKKNVAPHVKEFIYDKELNKFGYEFSLTKEFYKFKKPRSLDEIKNDLQKIEKDIKNLENDL